jgi:hypothetical protein
VGQVVVDCECEVASDGSRSRFERVGRTHHGSNRLDRVGTLDGDCDNRSAGQVGANVVEERSLFVLGIVSFDGRSLGVDQLEADDFEAAGFDSAGDFADEVSANAAWLDEHESGFHRLPKWYQRDYRSQLEVRRVKIVNFFL